MLYFQQRSSSPALIKAFRSTARQTRWKPEAISFPLVFLDCDYSCLQWARTENHNNNSNSSVWWRAIRQTRYCGSVRSQDTVCDHTPGHPLTNRPATKAYISIQLKTLKLNTVLVTHLPLLISICYLKSLNKPVCVILTCCFWLDLWHSWACSH